jgi:hypothetical protein
MRYIRTRSYGKATVVASNSNSSTLAIPPRNGNIRIAIEIFNTGAQTIYRGPTAASVADGEGIPMPAGSGVLLDSFLDNDAIHFRSSNTSTGEIRWIEYAR